MMNAYGFLPQVPAGLDPLINLALDLRWSWNHSADRLWQIIAPDLWERTGNPWLVLQTASGASLQRCAQDRAFHDLLNQVTQEYQDNLRRPTWFQDKYSKSPLKIAFFCMEFGLSEALPIYSGGLGILAGDYLKTADDLGVPATGVGLLYQQGYFRQALDVRGEQLEYYPYNDPGQLPLVPVTAANGELLRLSLDFPGRTLALRVWEAKIGRLKLLLLDSNDPYNSPADRGITGELYAGGPELRLQQEIVLGIGGWRALEALGLEPDVCHLNEGHPALAALERVRSIMKSKKQTFETALSTARAGNIFTTHTPVAAGFDRFSPTLVVRYFANYVADLGIPISLLLELGRENSQDAAEAFNMAYLAIRTSGTVNGVSRLHSEVSRRLFQPLFPRWPEVEVPVHYVTNGVHMPSWDSEAADQLWTQACGKGRWLGTLGTIKQDLSRVSDQVFWDFRNQQRSRLIDYARRRMAQQLAFAGSKDSEILRCERMLDRCVLTLGFARRFASYKRPNLLLTDPGRLKRILTDLERPVQIIIAGKAHPEDLVGKALVKEWSEFMLDPSINTRILFIADYDIALALQMVQGVDVWINTPRRPWEACGTSGMKVLVNGGLNLSEMDGWWAEAYAPDSGWAIGDGAEHKDDHEWDAREAEQLYSILENQVIPDFYERDAGGIPCSWIARVRTSMADLTPRFSTNRMLREYVEDLYFPALERFRFRLGENQAAKISEWQHNILECWRNLSIKAVKVESSDGLLTFRIVAFLDGLSPEDVAVQVYAEADGEGEAEIHVARLAGVEHKEKELTYEAEVKTRRPVWHYTVRVIPYFPGVETPLEMNQIFWHDS